MNATPLDVPLIANEHCGINLYWATHSGPEVDNNNLVEDCQYNSHRTADTTWHLQTGGKASPKKQNLWQLSGSVTAQAYRQDPVSGCYYLVLTSDTPPIPVTSITIDGKPVGSDGNQWRTYQDDDDRDVTPRVKNRDFYTFDVSGQKYHPYIGLTTSTVNANLDTDTPEVCVGQTVLLGADWQNGIRPAADADIRWSLPDKYVNEAYPYSSTCTSYRQNTDLLTNSVQQCWYVNLPGGKVSVGMMLHFANGQSVFVEAKGNFTVYRPSVNFIYPHPLYPAPMTPMLTNGFLELGNDRDNYGIAAFEATVTSTNTFPGQANWTQLCNRSTIYATYTLGYWMDNATNFNGSVNVNPIGTCDFGDGPGVGSNWAYVFCTDSFKTYLVFTPDGGIGVTLGIVTWGWSGTETFGALSSSSTTPPRYTKDSDEFPVWLNIIHSSPGT